MGGAVVEQFLFVGATDRHSLVSYPCENSPGTESFEASARCRDGSSSAECFGVLANQVFWGVEGEAAAKSSVFLLADEALLNHCFRAQLQRLSFLRSEKVVVAEDALSFCNKYHAVGEAECPVGALLTV